MDKCPRDIGVAKYEGCPVPDTDKDGLNDDEDKCPAVAGPASNQGCPVIEKKIIEKVNFTARNIFFESLSSNLLDKSKKSLDEVVAILNADKLLMLSVEGHSDILGSVELNKKLSQERANSVKDYLISKGVDAKRLNAIGFGSANPIGDNKTPEGRAKNRRTELLLSNH
jgi:outer membrane protein OmpA-like peptidoglycan-associated protein